MSFEGLPNAPSTAHGARSAAATELRRSCDGAATESLLRRSCADQLRRAHSAARSSVALILHGRMRPA